MQLQKRLRHLIRMSGHALQLLSKYAITVAQDKGAVKEVAILPVAGSSTLSYCNSPFQGSMTLSLSLAHYVLYWWKTAHPFSQASIRGVFPADVRALMTSFTNRPHVSMLMLGSLIFSEP